MKFYQFLASMETSSGMISNDEKKQKKMEVPDQKKKIHIRCTYYRSSGKYYTEGEADFPLEFFNGCTYPAEYGRRLHIHSKLPGLSSGVWPEFFTVDVEDKYEELVIPIDVNAKNR